MNIQLHRTRLVSVIFVAFATVAGCNSGSTSLENSDDPASAPLTEPPNDPPMASNACMRGDFVNGQVVGQLADHVSDPNGDTLQFSLDAAPSQGAVDIDLASGRFTYTPSTTARGYMDFFRYAVTDTDGEIAYANMAVIVGKRRIMPFGDSITAGVTSYNSTTGDLPISNRRVGYRQPLLNTLHSEGYEVDFVGGEQSGKNVGLTDTDHEGHPGFRTPQLTANVQTWLNANPTDVMLIHVGTNDFSRNASPIELLLQEIANWSTLNHPVDLLVSTIIDHHANTFWDDVVEDYNADLRQRISTNWPDATLVDQYSALHNTRDMSPLTIDSVGLHPKTSGYTKMAATWMNALTQSAAVQKCL